MTTAQKPKALKWGWIHSHRASMADVSEYRTWMLDKKNGIPYDVHVSIIKRDSGVTDYTIMIQCRLPDEIRGWWTTSTAYYDEGQTKDVKRIVGKAEREAFKLVPTPSYISDDEYMKWRDNHPIKKHRRVASDYGIFITAKDGSESGWFDSHYGTIVKTNKFASRYSEAEARTMATSLSKNNPKYKFEARLMGKLDK